MVNLAPLGIFNKILFTIFYLLLRINYYLIQDFLLTTVLQMPMVIKLSCQGSVLFSNAIKFCLLMIRSLKEIRKWY